MTRWILTAAMTLLLFAPGVAGDWSQFRGGPGSTGVVELSDAPLDVLGAYDLPDPEARVDAGRPQYQAPGFVVTPEGPVAVFRLLGENGGYLTMRLADLPDLRYEAVLDLDQDADGARTVAYVASTDTLLLCVDGDAEQGILQAYDMATGTYAWGITPEPPVAAGPATEDVDNLNERYCDHVVVDPEEDALYILFGDDTQQHVQANSLRTGDHLWSSAIPVTTYDPDPTNVGVQAPAMTGGVAVFYTSLTRSDTGIVVHGAGDVDPFRRSSDVGGDHYAAWLDRDGAVIGGISSVEISCTDATASYGASASPAAVGGHAAMVLCDQLIMIDTATRDPTVVPLEGATPARGVPMAPVAWSREWLVASAKDTVHIGRTTQPLALGTVWQAGASAEIEDIVIDDDDAYVLVRKWGRDASPVENTSRESPLEIIRLDLETGEEVQRIASPALESIENRARITPWSDGLLVWDVNGPIVVLGTADPAMVPDVAIGSAYPARGETVPVTPTPAEQTPTEWLVAWGDGLVESFRPGDEIARSFDREGLMTLRVTAVFEDGRTATAEQELDVGGTPPRELNAIQTAFEPENQDMTFGILGLLVALTGGLIALSRRHRSRSRIARELQALDEAYHATKHDPIECETTLAERKAHARGLLSDGKLDDTQFAVIDRRIDELGSAHRMEAIEDRFAFLSVGMARTLRDMLADGRISEWERDHFIEALERDEHLTAGQKTQVRKQVDAWFGRDTGQRA